MLLVVNINNNSKYCFRVNFILLFLILCLSTIISSCSQRKINDNLPIIYIDSTMIESEIKIKQWQIIGPFPDDTTRFSKSDLSTENPGLFCDYLKDFGLSEGNVKESDIISLKKDNSSHIKGLTDEFSNKIIIDTNMYFYFSKYFRKKDNSTCYAFCEIYSPKDQDVLFVVGMDDGMIAWLNNKIIVSKAKMGGLLKFQYMVVGHLRKGKNLFYAKVYNIHYDWGMYVSIYSISAAKKVLNENNTLHVLNNWIYHSNDSLNINVALFSSPNQEYKLTISNYLKNVIVTKKGRENNFVTINISKFKKGIYSAKICLDTIEYEQPFYYGDDADLLLSGFVNKSLKDHDKKIKRNLDALLIRYRHLIDSTNKNVR